ncbi:MAG: hypothetical protein Q9165_000884 [Trypethelium subeluteriae]
MVGLNSFVLSTFEEDQISCTGLRIFVGNAEGLGETRKKELAKSGLMLGLRGEDDVLVIDDAAPPATIDTLITFDKGGVSSHPNHVSLLHGARAFTKALMRRHKGWDCPVTLYTLTSTNVVRKYLGLFDAPMTLLSSIVSKGSKKSARNDPDRLFFANGLSEYWAARRAMTTAHQSQMLWFRWFWIVLSRYMTLNDLKADTG